VFVFGFGKSQLAHGIPGKWLIESPDYGKVGEFFRGSLGKWTDFESIYPVILFPVKYRIFESDASYSAHEFRLDAVAYSYENSNLYLSFGGNKEIPVGTIPNCDHDGNVEYAWLEMQSDETYDFTIREVFTGIPGERLREFKFDKNGRRIK
jgi:hypothetical protein